MRVGTCMSLLSPISLTSSSPIATLSGDPAIARVLLERGANVNRRDSEGNTVLMVSQVVILDMHVTDSVFTSWLH